MGGNLPASRPGCLEHDEFQSTKVWLEIFLKVLLKSKILKILIRDKNENEVFILIIMVWLNLAQNNQAQICNHELNKL